MIEKYSIEKILSLNFYAHKSNKMKESLSEHSNKSLLYANKIIEINGYDKTIKKLLTNYLNKNNYDLKLVDFLYELCLFAVYYHDIGKINPYFQFSEDKMDNEELKNFDMPTTSDHSIYSMYIYNHIVYNEYLKFSHNPRRSIIGLILSFGIVISRHHSKLIDFDGNEIFANIHFNITNDIENIKKILKLINNEMFYITKESFKYYKQASIENFDEHIYLLLKLLNSLVITGDYYATSEFINKEKHLIEKIDNINELIDIYQKNEIYKKIDLYKKGKLKYEKRDINKLRTEMFLETEKNIENKGKFYYLEAPTGSGKTNVSINLALKLLKRDPSLKKIFYVFPFNTLVEQTKDFLNNVAFQNQVEVGVINSVDIPKYTDNPNYKRMWNINNIMYNYKINLTSHVHFFETLLGIGKESQYGFSHVANSVVIIDEIQSYKNNLWDKIITILDLISTFLNINFIIMSATLPNLNKLLLKDNKKIIKLISEPLKFYQNPLFLNRVELDFSLLSLTNFDLYNLKEKVNDCYKKGYKKILVEFINKSMARDFFEIAENFNEDIVVYEITGSDSSYFKRKMIKRIKESNDKILVISTQVIEAGVDIDFDAGFKHYSLLDSEEQFLGRINRSCKKKNAKAYFFKIGDIGIYRRDFRKDYTILNQKYQKILVDKDFNKYYDLVLKNLVLKAHKTDKEGLQSFYISLGMLKYQKIHKELKLIDNYKSYTIFVNFTYEDETGQKTMGAEVFKKLKELYKLEDYNIKQYELQRINEKVSIFKFDIVEIDSEGKLIKEPLKYSEKFGDIYYFDDLEEAIKIKNFIVKLDYRKIFTNFI